MKLRILGAHNYESKDTLMASYLIDDVLALDAGSLTRSLTFDEQSRVRAIILSHRHFDHTRDLFSMGMYARETGATIDIYGIEETVTFIRTVQLNPRDYSDFARIPSPERPAFRYHVVKPFEEFQVLNYTAMAVPVPHLVTAAGYQVSSGDLKLFYTGDTGVGVVDVLKRVSPNVLLSEVTFGNENKARALEVGHLTPSLLQQALEDFRAELGYLPTVIASHIMPFWEAAVRPELETVSRQLGIEIIVAEAGMTKQL